MARNCLYRPFNLKTSQESLNNEINHYFSFKELKTISFRQGRVLVGENQVPLALLCLSGTFGMGGTWGLLEGVERLGCENPSTSTRTPSILTLAGEHLEDDESSFEAAVLKDLLNP